MLFLLLLLLLLPGSFLGVAGTGTAAAVGVGAGLLGGLLIADVYVICRLSFSFDSSLSFFLCCCFFFFFFLIVSSFFVSLSVSLALCIFWYGDSLSALVFVYRLF